MAENLRQLGAGVEMRLGGRHDRPGDIFAKVGAADPAQDRPDENVCLTQPSLWRGHVLDPDISLVVGASAVAAGARLADTVEALVAESDVVITTVAGDAVLHEIVFGAGGLAQHLRPSQVLIDLSTVSPRLSANIAQVLDERPIGYLRAPVSGSTTTAQSGQLTVIVSLAIGQCSGLPLETLMDAICESAVGSPLLNYKRDAILAGGFQPYLSCLADGEGPRTDPQGGRCRRTSLEMTDNVRRRFEAARRSGLADQDCFVLVREHIECLATKPKKPMLRRVET